LQQSPWRDSVEVNQYASRIASSGAPEGVDFRAHVVKWADSALGFESPVPIRRRIQRACEYPLFQLLGIRDMAFRRMGIHRPLGPGVHFIYLHHVFAEEVVPFRALLSRLAKESRIIGHSVAARRARSGEIDRSYVSVSFDDGLKTCEDAARILEEFGTVGCFFACPGVVDRSGDDAWIAHWCRNALLRSPARVMDWDDLERLQDRGHEIGNHTMHHVNLAATPKAARGIEIHESRELLVKRLGLQAGVHFAWPYGEARYIDEDALREIREAGHETCSSAVRGVHLPQAPTHESAVILRQHVAFHRPLSATEYFMRRSARMGASAFTLEGR
jgi:peptidoglycan/xylan/chitin deacetylase (PgdA/CDA1 family)